jgi:hypothetical protein
VAAYNPHVEVPDAEHIHLQELEGAFAADLPCPCTEPNEEAVTLVSFFF